MKLKTNVFDQFHGEEIPLEDWKKESHRFMHYYPEEVEQRLLDEISVEGKVSR